MQIVAHKRLAEAWHGSHVQYEGHETVRKTLMERPFLRPARLTRTGFLIDRLIRKKRYQVNDFMELNSLRTVIDLVRRDVGVSIVPLRRDEIQEADPQLHVVPFHDSQACRHIGLFENQERTHLTSVLRRLVREEVARQHEESDPA